MEIKDRLKLIMKMHNLTASAFADKIGVQRSSISHIMSGRNYPSLDFIEKTLNSFPRVNAGWLITGKQQGSTGLETEIDNKPSQSAKHQDNDNIQTETEIEEVPVQKAKEESNQEIDKIVVFYKNGTFKAYKQMDFNA